MREQFTVLAVCFGWCMEDFEEVDENLERRRESSESRIRAADKGNGRLPCVLCSGFGFPPLWSSQKVCVVVTKQPEERRQQERRGSGVWCRSLVLLRPVRVLCLPTLPKRPTTQTRLYLLPNMTNGGMIVSAIKWKNTTYVRKAKTHAQVVRVRSLPNLNYLALPNLYT